MLVLILAAAGSSPLSMAQEPPKITTPERLKPLAYLIGTWHGEGEMEGLGKYTDEFVYSWNKTKTFINASYKMMVGDKVMWTDESVIGWDPEFKKIVGFTFGQDGSIGRGVCTESAKDTVTIEGKSVGNTPFKEWQMIMIRKDDSNMEVNMNIRKGTEWAPMMKGKYKRVIEK